jgi:hypothetical protein
MDIDSLPYYLYFLMLALFVGAWVVRKPAHIRMPYVHLLPHLIMPLAFAGFGFNRFILAAAIGGGRSETARFGGQPPTSLAPAAARHDVAPRST